MKACKYYLGANEKCDMYLDCEAQWNSPTCTGTKTIREGQVAAIGHVLITRHGPSQNQNIATFEYEGDATKVEVLWNAADGMTTEQAVKYLEHGAEMVEVIKGIHGSFNLINDYMPDGLCRASVRGYFMFEDSKVANLLTKLEAND